MAVLLVALEALAPFGLKLLGLAALQDGAVEVNGWWLAGGAAAIVIAFIVYQAIQNAKAARAKAEVIEQGPAVMEESRFWDLVHEAKRAAGDDMFRRPAELTTILRALDPLDVSSFHERYTEESIKGDKPSLRAVADAFIKNCTDSNFVAFRDWLISEGRERFHEIVADPSALPAPVGKEVVTLEAFGYIAPKVYKSKAGKPISRAIEDQIAAAGG